MVVSFRNDGDGPPSCDGRYRLGETEWRDVEEAINYAVAEGAGRIVIFGWSLGAAIALQVVAVSSHASRISGLVLDAPVFPPLNLGGSALRGGLPVPAPSAARKSSGGSSSGFGDVAVKSEAELRSEW
jgi:pimeloyl-ACP methyl ester carboxylesterase